MNGISFLEHIEIHTIHTLYCICLRRWYFWLETMVIIKIESHSCHPIHYLTLIFIFIGMKQKKNLNFRIKWWKTNPYSPIWKNQISLIHQFSNKQFKKKISSPWKSGSNGRVAWMELKSLPLFPAKKTHLRKHMQYNVLYCFLSFAANDVVCT